MTIFPLVPSGSACFLHATSPPPFWQTLTVTVFHDSLQRACHSSHYVFWKINGLSSGLCTMNNKLFFSLVCYEWGQMQLVLKLSRISWAVRAVWLCFWCCGEVGLLPPQPCRSVWTLADCGVAVAESEMIQWMSIKKPKKHNCYLLFSPFRCYFCSVFELINSLWHLFLFLFLFRLFLSGYVVHFPSFNSLCVSFRS